MFRRPPDWRRALGKPALAACLIAVASCATNPVTGEQDFVLIDEQREIEQGRKAHEQVLKEYPAYRDPRLQEYVNALGQKLARGSHRAQLAWTFSVVDSPEVNAFALPGGYVYVTRGLMAYLSDEAELAGVLGHEIGHVTARHGVRQQSASAAAAAVGSLLGTAVDSYLGTNNTFARVASGAAGIFTVSYGREQELQADQLGAQYLARTGYDAQAMIRVIEVLQLQEAFDADTARAEGRAMQESAGWLSSHPPSEQRLAEIRRVAKGYASTATGAGAARYLAAIDGLVFGHNPAQGVLRGRGFYHLDLGFALRLPQGWRAQSKGAQVVAISEDRAASFLFRPVPAGYVSHDDFLLRGMKIQTFPAKGATNGLPTTRITGAAQGRTYVVTLVRLQDADYMLLANERDSTAVNAHGGELESIARSFRALDGADREAARALVIRTATLPAGQTIAELARRSPLASHPEEQLRLLNNLYPGGEPLAGATVKIVQ